MTRSGSKDVKKKRCRLETIGRPISFQYLSCIRVHMNKKSNSENQTKHVSASLSSEYYELQDISRLSWILVFWNGILSNLHQNLTQTSISTESLSLHKTNLNKASLKKCWSVKTIDMYHSVNSWTKQKSLNNRNVWRYEQSNPFSSDSTRQDRRRINWFLVDDAVTKSV